MLEINSAVIGGRVGILLGGAGWFIKRIISGERRREQASFYSTIADIAGTMKAQGLNHTDIEAVAATLKLGKTQARARDVPPSQINADEKLSDNIPDYWTQSAMNLRAAAATRVADAQLESVVLEILSLVSEDEHPSFQAAQKAWEKFRRAQAIFAGREFAGGSLESLLRSTEYEDVTLKRLAELRALVDQKKVENGIE